LIVSSVTQDYMSEDCYVKAYKSALSQQDYPVIAAGQVCRASLPGKSAGQVCWASLPGKSDGQVCPLVVPGPVTCGSAAIKINKQAPGTYFQYDVF
jgi:hypothetical protein